MLFVDYCIQNTNYNNIYTFGYFMRDGHVVRIPGQWPHQGY